MPVRDALLEPYVKVMALRLATIACVFMLWVPASAQTTLLDAVLAEVGPTIITASDVALARGLGVFGLHPSEAPIQSADIDRYLDAELVEQEARRLGLGGSPDQLEDAWRATQTRSGGEAVLTAWLDRIGVEPAWARRLVEADVRRGEFLRLRFRSLAFISESEVTEALGPGPQTPEARQRVREALLEEVAKRSLAAWLREVRTRAAIRHMDIGPEGVPTPFPMPPGASQVEPPHLGPGG